MPEIRKYGQMENLCYMNDQILNTNKLHKCFMKGERDAEYKWFIKENYNNKELIFA